MPSTRAHLYFPLQAKGSDGSMEPVAGANVLVCEPGTAVFSPASAGTPLTKPMFPDATTASHVSNPLATNNLGVAEAWVDDPQSVDLYVTGTNLVTTVFRGEFTPYNSGP